MPMLTWSDKMSVGVKAMDEQHKRLVDSLNALHSAMLQGHAKEQTGPLLDTLVKYTHDHFAAEEALMSRAKYPELPAHSEKHKALTTQVMDFAGRYQRGEVALDVHLLTFLCDWLTTHIQKEDKAYGPWLNAIAAR